MKDYDATEVAYKNGYEAGRKSAIKTNNQIYWILAIENSIIMICFAALAIAFHKWWIVLFASLFFSYVKSRKYYRVCDGCGKHSPDADSYNGALDRAKLNGWVHYVDNDRDYCPDCKNVFKR